MIKIAYALYYHIYKKTWESSPAPFYKQFIFDDGTTDIEVRFPGYKNIPDYHVYEGKNQAVFKYLYIEGNFSGRSDCLLKMIFYGGFEVVIMPLYWQQSAPSLILQTQKK
jgi:hypothetical protein